jgi:hypothetical protein
LLLVDAANVVGSRPDGWWRDRPGAARRLVDQLREAVAASRLPEGVIAVLEGAARQGVGEGAGGGVDVVHAPGEGDDTLAAIAAGAAEAGESVQLVSADRALGERVRASGATVVGPRWLLDRLAVQ